MSNYFYRFSNFVQFFAAHLQLMCITSMVFKGDATLLLYKEENFPNRVPFHKSMTSYFMMHHSFTNHQSLLNFQELVPFPKMERFPACVPILKKGTRPFLVPGNRNARSFLRSFQIFCPRQVLQTLFKIPILTTQTSK